MGCVCLCVGYAFSHFLDFDDATAILRFPPTRMQPPTDFTPFFVFFRLYINTLIGGFPSVCLSVCLCVCWLRFFAFFGFRRCNSDSTVPAYSHAAANRFHFIFRFFFDCTSIL